VTLKGRPGHPLDFDPARKPGGGEVGCVHPDGSISYRGKRYRTLRELPASCRALRADLSSAVQWRKLYRAVDPKRRRS
jgi:hypothetical protein